MRTNPLHPSPFRDYGQWRDMQLTPQEMRRNPGMRNHCGTWLVVDDAEEVEWGVLGGRAEFQLGDLDMLVSEKALVRWMKMSQLALDELRADKAEQGKGVINN
jgi:hypothetical protein